MCWSSTKQASSSLRWKLTFYRHDIAENGWVGVKQQSPTHSCNLFSVLSAFYPGLIFFCFFVWVSWIISGDLYNCFIVSWSWTPSVPIQKTVKQIRPQIVLSIQDGLFTKPQWKWNRESFQNGMHAWPILMSILFVTVNPPI